MKTFDFIDRIKIREAYLDWEPNSDPYSYFNWMFYFTPIEKNVWAEIRYLGLPFYPQYPIKNFFVDFADPVAKIVIEVDVKEWHQDKTKDAQREVIIRKAGWHIVRIPGRNTYKNKEDFLSENEIVDNNYSYEEQQNLLYTRGYQECAQGILESLFANCYSSSALANY